MIWTHKSVKLLVVLAAIFVAIALLAELVGVKIFALEDSLGLEPFNWNLFGQEGSLNFTVGVLLWPVVFVLTDIVNEYFGKRGVLFLSWLTVTLIVFAFLIVYVAIHLSPASWWPGSSNVEGIDNLQLAFESIFGQGLWIIAASVIAFLLGQFLDAFVFQQIKKFTGDKKLWLRATGSTLISQLIDSVIVLYIAFVLGPANWSINLFFAVATVNYTYKVLAAILLTPIIYQSHKWIDKYLGLKESEALKKAALTEELFNSTHTSE